MAPRRQATQLEEQPRRGRRRNRTEEKPTQQSNLTVGRYAIL